MSSCDEYSNELRKFFTGEIKFDIVTRQLYSTDASIYQITPMGVVFPKNQEELIAAVELAIKYHLPILPRGSGSSLAGQAIGEAVIIDHSRYLNKFVGPIDVEESAVSVEPGMILSKLNREAAKVGLMFGPDPASAERATIGGVIGNNATGAHSIRYGMTADHLLHCDVIQSDGSTVRWGNINGRKDDTSLHGKVINTAYDIRERSSDIVKQGWPKTWRNSAGYRINYLLPWSVTKPAQWEHPDYPLRARNADFNLSTLLAGSEGTLAVIRQARLKLVKIPKFTLLAILAYPSIKSACDDVTNLLLFRPSAIELIPQNLIQLAKNVPAYSKNSKYFNDHSEAFLAVEFSGEDIISLRKQINLNRDIIHIAENIEEQESIWATRKVGLGLFDSASNQKRPVAFIEDCAIPVENLGEFVSELQKIFSQFNVSAAFYAHASAGCLHVRPIIDLQSQQGRESIRGISNAVQVLTSSLGGSMSSEHGDGLARGEWIEKTYGSEIFQLFRNIKDIADPHRLLNPNKIIDTPLLDTNFRYINNMALNSWEPSINFESTGGFLRTIEKCNGQGVCRKETGVMCPSFQVTGDEAFSTRGRANLLREFIYSSDRTISTKDLKQTFDLCLACKGCISECPSKVDVAKLKIAFMERYYQDHPHSIRDFIFGYLPAITSIFGSMPYIFNLGVDLVENIGILRRWIGISSRHNLPRMQKKKLTALPTKTEGLKCILIADAYNHYLDPNIESDALELLDRLGFRVVVTKTIGTGRTLLSKGYLHQAKEQLLSLMAEIQQLDPLGECPILGLEPSEISVLKDEIFDLIGSGQMDDSIDNISNRTYFIDEFLLRIVTKVEDFQPKIIERPEVLLHAHCHQKAQAQTQDNLPVGMEATRSLLLKFGYKVKVLQTGCCGMAGSFGFESENSKISDAIGNLALFPAIRSQFKVGETVICSPGTSCRTQIMDGVNKPAYHTVELLVKEQFNFS